jgi:enolase
MEAEMRIEKIQAREVLDSRGWPTVEVDVQVAGGFVGRAAVPSGASKGSREACELRDGVSRRYLGKGVTNAVAHVNGTIAGLLMGHDASDQEHVDGTLRREDGTELKTKLGANAILGVSMAVARAAAAADRMPLYLTLAAEAPHLLPVPMFNVLNGGVHADNNVDFQEFMIAPVGAPSFREALRMGSETYHALQAILKQRGLHTSVGDEGGFAPDLRANVEAIEVILAAIELAGFKAGSDIALALDPAASEFYRGRSYVLGKSGGRLYSSEELVALYEDWIRQFPIASIEDGLAESDWSGWRLMTERLAERVQLVGDDIFVTNATTLRRGIDEGVANSVLIKLNQVGTITETLETMRVAATAGYTTVISHRSGETTDDFIADFAVATAAGQIKTGAPCRGERVAKYNQLARIEEELGDKARFAGRSALKVHAREPTS